MAEFSVFFNSVLTIFAKSLTKQKTFLPAIDFFEEQILVSIPVFVPLFVSPKMTLNVCICRLSGNKRRRKNKNFDAQRLHDDLKKVFVEKEWI